MSEVLQSKIKPPCDFSSAVHRLAPSRQLALAAQGLGASQTAAVSGILGMEA